MADEKEPDYSTRLLEALFTDQHRSWQPIGSQVIGLLGLAVFAISIAIVASAGFRFLSGPDFTISDPGIRRFVGALIATPCVTALYVVIGLAMHWIASCQLPIAIRLAFIYGILFLCLTIVVGSRYEDPLGGVHVLFFAPFCIGGFVQKRHGWEALSWGQEITVPKKPTVGKLMDVTAAIALTLAILPTAKFNPGVLACWIPSGCVLAAMGMHLWGRLTLMCESDRDHINGYGMWMMGNICISAGVIVILIGMNRSSIELSVVVLPLSYLTAYVCAALVIRWLRICGWRFERFDENPTGNAEKQ